MAFNQSLLRVVSPQLCCAAQLDEDALALLANEGTVWVINLGLEQADYALEGESQIAEALGMGYCNIPVQFDAPRQIDFEHFCQVMQQHSNAKVMVHCAANKRASCFVALWMELQHGWSVEQADHLINSIWQPNDTWMAFMASARGALVSEPGAE